MRAPAKVHYLPANDKVWTPPCVIYLDTETYTIPGAVPEVLALELWCARLVDRKPKKGGDGETIDGEGDTAQELAEWIETAIIGRSTVWLYCHNLSFDIATTRLPLVLARAGWTITDAAVSGSAPWMRLVRGSRHLTLVDSWSWLPHPLSDLGEALHLAKPPLPKERQHRDKLRARCWADVDILAAAMEQLHDWWDRERLGRWTVSGAGCGWNAMRHIKPPVRPTIDPDPSGVGADRLAIHGGRRGAWVVGSRSQGPFIELDFRNAYPAIAADLPLPSRRMTPFDSMDLDNWRIRSERWGIIAECEIKTDVARWPVRFSGGTFCPTGSFRAHLAGPEIRDALRLGCLTRIGSGYVHQLSHHMLPWARWVLATSNNTTAEVPPIARLAAKSWSRSVIGKWATRGYTKTALGPSPVQDWGFQEGWDHTSQTRGAMIDLAGRRWWTCAAGDAEQAYPAVLAWIESETRVRLTRVIEAIGVGAILQCDTDGLIANERIIGTREAGGFLVAPHSLTGPARTKWILDQIDPIVAPLIMRVKATHKTVRVLGPQHVHTPSDRSFSGLPKLATEGEPDVYTFKAWPKLAYQMSDGDPRGYVRPEQVVTVRGPYAPGWVTTSGTVVPPEAALRADGSTRLLGWHEMTRKPPTARLADAQHPALAALW